MPQYLLSMFQEEGAPSRPHAKTPGRSWRASAPSREEMNAAGAWVFFGGLTDAKVVRAAGGEVSMTDGPHAEAKEKTGGSR
jgi:hypothetical protein